MVKTSKFLEEMGGSMEKWEIHRNWFREQIAMYKDVLRLSKEAKKEGIGDEGQWDRAIRHDKEKIKELEESLAPLEKWMRLMNK